MDWHWRSDNSAQSASFFLAGSLPKRNYRNSRVSVRNYIQFHRWGTRFSNRSLGNKLRYIFPTDEWNNGEYTAVRNERRFPEEPDGYHPWPGYMHALMHAARICVFRICGASTEQMYCGTSLIRLLCPTSCAPVEACQAAAALCTAPSTIEDSLSLVKTLRNLDIAW